MTASGRFQSWLRWITALLSVVLLVTSAEPASAWGWGRMGSMETGSAVDPLAPTAPSGRLQEVAPPGAVQQLQTALAAHHPQLQLTSPADGTVLQPNQQTLVLQVSDWPLAQDPEFGLGAHVALQIDDQPPLRFSEAEGGRLRIQLPALTAGSHRFTAYAAMPWGEAVKTPGASLQWRFDQLQGLEGTQPAPDAPWLAMVSPSDLGGGEPLFLDWLIWNAPLQNLREGDARWRLRISVNGDSFLVDRQESLWIKGGGNGPGRVQMELLDGVGEPMSPVFNNQLRPIAHQPGSRPIWMQSRLSDAQIARLLGDVVKSDESPDPELESGTEPATEAATEPQVVQEPVALEKPLDEPMNEPMEEAIEGPAEEVLPPEATAAETPTSADARPEEVPQEDTPQEDTPPSAESAPAPAPQQEAPQAAPSSSLGGSARELLNADGTQR